MKVFIVYCHPSEDSFTRNVRDAFIKGIVDSGNEYDMSDLYSPKSHSAPHFVGHYVEGMEEWASWYCFNKKEDGSYEAEPVHARKSPSKLNSSLTSCAP